MLGLMHLLFFVIVLFSRNKTLKKKTAIETVVSKSEIGDLKKNQTVNEYNAIGLHYNAVFTYLVL